MTRLFEDRLPETPRAWKALQEALKTMKAEEALKAAVMGIRLDTAAKGLKNEK